MIQNGYSPGQYTLPDSLAMAAARRWIGERQSLVREAGATAVEYALMVALISVVIMGAVGTLGTSLDDKFGRVNTAVGGGNGGNTGNGGGGNGGNSGNTNGWGMGSGGGQGHNSP